MAISELSLQLLSRRWLTEREDGLALFAAIEELAPELTPERYDEVEPVRRPRGGAANAVDDLWGDSILWEGGGGVSGSASPRHYAAMVFSNVHIDVPYALGVEVERAEFAVLHPVTPLDRDRGYDAGYLSFECVDRDSDYLSVVGADLEKYVPDLSWCTVFGPSYVELFGDAAVDAHEVRRLGDDRLLIRFSEDPGWVDRCPDAFEDARDGVKRRLGADAFFDLERGERGAYRTPPPPPDPWFVPPPPAAALADGQELVDPAGDVWIVAGSLGGRVTARRARDGRSRTLGAIAELFANGTFRLR